MCFLMIGSNILGFIIFITVSYSAVETVSGLNIEGMESEILSRVHTSNYLEFRRAA